MAGGGSVWAGSGCSRAQSRAHFCGAAGARGGGDAGAEDPEHAAHANRLSGFSDSVWKYRCKQSSASRGSSGGYRIIALYDRAAGVLTPLLLYAKIDQSDVSRATVKNALVELRQALRASPEKPEG